MVEVTIRALHPLPGPPLRTEVLLARWRALPRVDPTALRADVDTALDTSP